MNVEPEPWISNWGARDSQSLLSRRSHAIPLLNCIEMYVTLQEEGETLRSVLPPPLTSISGFEK